MPAPAEPTLPVRDDDRYRQARFIGRVVDYVNGVGPDAQVSGGDYFERMLALYRDEEVDAKGRFRVSPTEKLGIFRAFGEIAATVKQSEREQGLAKVPAIHQHAHVEQHFAMPKALFDTLTPEQKRLIAEGGKQIVVAPAEVRPV